VKKPAGVTKEQWANYQKNLKLAQDVITKSLDLIADTNFMAGELVERKRILKLLEPLARHDESCYYNKQLACYPEDCHASDFKYAISLIQGDKK
jgi:hypothetical protein